MVEIHHPNPSGWPSEFAAFGELARPNMLRQCSAHVSMLCLEKEGDKNYANLSSTVLLGPPALQSGGLDVSYCEFAGLHAVAAQVAHSDIPRLLGAIRDGSIPGDLLGLARDVQLVSTMNRQSCDFLLLDRRTPEGLSMFGYPYGGYRVEALGAYFREILPQPLLDDLLTRLPAHDPPFSSLLDLCVQRRAGNPDSLRHGSERTNIQLLSPIWTTIRSVVRSQTDRRVNVTLASLWSDCERDHTVSVIPRQGQSDRRLECLTDAGWTTAAEGPLTLYNSDLGLEEGPYELTLNCAERMVLSQVTGDGSTRLAAHELSDPDYAKLRERLGLLAGKTPKSDQFEHAVHWLLHLCGFSSAYYGVKGMERTPDVVALLDPSHAVVAECSIELPDWDKLRKLTSRAQALRARTRSRYHREIRLVRAIFLPFTPDQLMPDDTDRAAQEHAVIVTSDVMSCLLDMASRGESALSCFGILATANNPRGPVYL